MNKAAMLNIVAFQVGWFACVLGAAYGLPATGSSIALAIVAWHVLRAAAPRAELALVLIAGAIGAAFDSVLAVAGWVTYADGSFVPGAAPYWIIALWMVFATTLNRSLAWLRGRPALAALFGACGGPLAYLGGAKLGALALTEPAAALIALAIGWGVCTPVLMRLALRYDGGRPPSLSASRSVETGHA